jgi:hypothetical protein
VAIIAYYIWHQRQLSNEGGVDQLTMDDFSEPTNKQELEPTHELIRQIDLKAASLEKDLTGELSKDGFLRFQMLITENVNLQFKQKKEELMEQRIQAFKEKDWQKYGTFIQMAAQEMTKLTAEATQKACEHKGYN